MTGKYHPADAEHLRFLVGQLKQTHGEQDYDVYTTWRKELLITVAERTKLINYVGTIRGSHANDDIDAIISACVLRFRRGVGQLARANVPVRRVEPAAAVPEGAGRGHAPHARAAGAAEGHQRVAAA